MESLRGGAGNLALAVEQSGSHHGSLQHVDLGKAPTRPCFEDVGGHTGVL